MAGVARLNSRVRLRFVSNKKLFQALVLWISRGNAPDADGDFSNAPYFKFNDSKLKFDANWTDNANDNYGSASAFLPKSLCITKGILSDTFCINAQNF
jgi:hypothetical protein